MRRSTLIPLLVAFSVLAACADKAPGVASAVLAPSHPSAARGPETPPFNLQVVLRGELGFGLVKFRQPNDGVPIIYLDTWVRDLAPNASYVLQRAVDTNLDGECTSSAWLTLGKGLTPQTLTTDDRGTAREELWRSVAAFPVGTSFDIHFRVIEVATGDVVLSSGCYRFTISL